MGVRLPAEYQEVEYIETTGTQYIQTSYTPQNADEIVCDFAVVGSIVGAVNAQVLFSAGTGTNQLVFLLNNTSGETPVDGAYYKYFASGNAARLFFYPSYDTKYRLEIGNDGTANCNGYSVQSNYEGTVNTALRLMRRANGHSSFKGKCYQFILSNGGEVKLHLIPCYRKSDSKPGMYDLVTGAFFVNAGTGEFTVGPDVIDSISPLMVAWRRAMMGAKSAAVEPIYRISNYDFNNGVIDTSVLLAQEGSIGYSIIAKVDCGNNTHNNPSIINGAGIYGSYSFIYLTNAKPVYGIQSYRNGNQYHYPPEGKSKTWLSSICISVNLQAMTTCVFMNDQPATNGTITSFATPTTTLKINPDNHKATNIILNWLEIYPYPMTEAQMRTLIQQ